MSKKRSSALFAASLFIAVACNNAEQQVDQVEHNAAFQLNQLGDSVTSTGNYPGAIQFYQRSIDSAAAHADSFIYFDSKLDLANVYSFIGEQSKAIAIAEPVLKAFYRSGDTSRIGRTYSTLSIFYGRAEMPEKTLDAARQGFQILRHHGSLIEQCAAYNQMAFTYSDAGRWEDALPLLDTALTLMKASGVLDQLPSMLLNVGDCHRKLGHESQARIFLQEASHHADSLGQKHVHAKALERLSQLSESTGDFKEALRLYRQSGQLMDSIFTEENNRAIHQLELSHLELEKENEINQIKANNKLESTQLYFSLVLVSVLLGIAAERLYRWRKKLGWSKEKLAGYREELFEFANVLIEKNTRLALLESALRRHEDESTLPAAPPITHPEDFLFNTAILTDADWAAFKSHFERAYPGFIFRLRKAFPELSSAEERLFLLLRLNFQRQEIAATLGISIDSVKKGRNRLRKRLKLNEGHDLEQYIREF